MDETLLVPLGGMFAGGIANAAVNDSWDSFAGGIVGSFVGVSFSTAYLKSISPANIDDLVYQLENDENLSGEIGRDFGESIQELNKEGDSFVKSALAELTQTDSEKSGSVIDTINVPSKAFSTAGKVAELSGKKGLASALKLTGRTLSDAGPFELLGNIGGGRVGTYFGAFSGAAGGLYGNVLFGGTAPYLIPAGYYVGGIGGAAAGSYLGGLIGRGIDATINYFRN